MRLLGRESSQHPKPLQDLHDDDVPAGGAFIGGRLRASLGRRSKCLADMLLRLIVLGRASARRDDKDTLIFAMNLSVLGSEPFSCHNRWHNFCPVWTASVCGQSRSYK